MAPKNLLVVMLEGGSRSGLQQAVARRGDGSPNVHVVAPTQVGPLEWLATDEDSARAEAGVRALEAEWLLTTEADVDGETGDVDPVLAVEDALRKFPADEIMLVGGAEEDGALEAALRRFGVPVTRVGEPPPPGRRSLLREAARGLAAGRSKATPFVFFAAVNLFLLALAALITLIVLLILWLS